MSWNVSSGGDGGGGEGRGDGVERTGRDDELRNDVELHLVIVRTKVGHHLHLTGRARASVRSEVREVTSDITHTLK